MDTDLAAQAQYRDKHAFALPTTRADRYLGVARRILRDLAIAEQLSVALQRAPHLGTDSRLIGGDERVPSPLLDNQQPVSGEVRLAL